MALGRCSPCPQKRFILDCGIRNSKKCKSGILKSSPFTNPDPAIEAWAIGVNTACRYVIQLFHFGWMNCCGGDAGAAVAEEARGAEAAEAVGVADGGVRVAVRASDVCEARCVAL
jgi:hypothetical protein